MSASALLLLPRALDGFILREQVRDLLRAPGVHALGPPARVPYGAFARIPASAMAPLGRAVAARLPVPDDLRAVTIFHPLQLPVAEALVESNPAHPAELWYARWDRFEAALDARPALRDRLRTLHERAAARSALTFAASGDLARDAGPSAVAVGLAADAFPAAIDPGDTVVAWSLGHLGRRVDWGLLRAVCERMPELVVLLVGEVHPGEMAGDADFAACRSQPGLVWLGRRSDAEAAALLQGADVGVLPFAPGPFNEGALPYRILKAARLGRRTITPMLAGVLTWERAVVRADGPDAWVAALRAERGRRAAPDLELRAWALEQTAERVDGPLWERLRELGVA